MEKKGFTLLELLIVIVILGALASLITGNFISSLKKGRDARRKTDLTEIQKALEMYYESNGFYPSSLSFGGSLSDANRTYMQKVPTDPTSNCSYLYRVDSSAQSFYLLSTIENSQDQSDGVSQSGYEDPDSPGNSLQCGNCTCKFYLSSPNATPLTPMP